MADNKEYEILIDGEDDIEVETDSVSYLPFDNKTINQNSKGEMQAIGITNGTDIIDYATIKAGIDKPAPQPFEFETKKDFEDWLSGTFTREDGRTVDDLLIGNDVYIVEKSVPDYWCKSVTKPFSIEKNFEEMETDVDNNLSNTSINPVQNKVITGALELKQDALTAGENITIQNNVISVDGKITKYFTGTNIELYNKIASGEFKLGDFVWLDNVTKDPSITDITDTKLVDGKVLMQIVEGPHNYKRSVPMMKIYFEFRKCYTVILYNVKFKVAESSYGSGSYLKSVTSTDEFSIYKTYFTMEANPNSKVQTVSAYYWFVSVSALSGISLISGVPANERLDAIDKILKDNDQAVTSGAVYTALEKKQNTLTTSQLQAVNSGATEEKINQIATNTTNITLKQNKLSDVQLSAVNSGITDTKVAQIATNTSDIATLQTQIGNIDTLLTQIDSGSGV